MEESVTIWQEREALSKIYWSIRNSGKNWAEAYRLALPPPLAKLHDVFHVSMLRRYRSDDSHILPLQDIEIQHDFSYDEKPKRILAKEVRKLRNKTIPLVKVFGNIMA